MAETIKMAYPFKQILQLFHVGFKGVDNIPVAGKSTDFIGRNGKNMPSAMINDKIAQK